jgi:hypothetical protein
LTVGCADSIIVQTSGGAVAQRERTCMACKGLRVRIPPAPPDSAVGCSVRSAVSGQVRSRWLTGSRCCDRVRMAAFTRESPRTSSGALCSTMLARRRAYDTAGLSRWSTVSSSRRARTRWRGSGGRRRRWAGSGCRSLSVMRVRLPVPGSPARADRPGNPASSTRLCGRVFGEIRGIGPGKKPMAYWF